MVDACDIFDVVYSLSFLLLLFFFKAITNILCCQHTFILLLSVHGLSSVQLSKFCSSVGNYNLYLWDAQQNSGWNT